MIPYFNIQIPGIPIPIIHKKLTIHLFGILVAIGILVGARLTRTRGRELGLVDENVASMITTTLLCGFVFAHLFDVFAYQSAVHMPTIGEILDPTQGFSSFGGFMGALGGLFYWCRRHKQPVMPYADSLAFGLATGWMFGRLGCFSAHDHPGIHSSFFLAIAGGFDSNRPPPWNDGYPRLDLGLLEAIWAAGIAASFAILRRKRRPIGIYVTILTLAYAPVRFGLDFLRVTEGENADPRYGGLTPAQWGCFLVVAAGIGLAIWTRAKSQRQRA